MLSAQAHLALSKVQNTIGGRAERACGEPARFMLAWKRAAWLVTTGATLKPQALRDLPWFHHVRQSRQPHKTAPWHLDRVRSALHRASEPATCPDDFDATHSGEIHCGSNARGLSSHARFGWKIKLW